MQCARVARLSRPGKAASLDGDGQTYNGRMLAKKHFSLFVTARACVALLPLACALPLAQAQDRAAQPEPVVVYERVVSSPPLASAPATSAAPAQGGQAGSGTGDAGDVASVALPEGQAPAARSAVRIYQEDAGSRVEELRVRGQTQTITVTPAGTMPSYEVRPGGSQNYQHQGNRAADGTNGPRRWKIGEF